MLAIPTATNIIRFLPPLNLRRAEADEALRIIKAVVEKISP
jgi:acetylornithine/succinyldiaminopimelate/putrescine aminotransferase